MKMRKAQKLLKKISALIENSDNGQNALEAIERDLLLSYLRQLYELVLQAKIEAGEEETKETGKKETPKAEPTPAPPKKTEVKPKPEPKVQLETNQTPPITKPEPIPEPEPQPKTLPTNKPQAPLSKTKSKSTVRNEELEELFQLPVAKELSEKLSTLPIKDLSKAMGLNEKIFTIKELFGDDQELFNQTLSRLNGLSSFEEARSVLIDLAERFNWMSKAKKKKAKNFIKLVSRRYK